MNIELDGFDAIHRIGENATSVIAPFSSPLTALLLLAECSLRRRRALPAGWKKAQSRLSNYRF